MENLYGATLQEQLKLLENLALCILSNEKRAQLYANVKTYSSRYLTDVETYNLHAKVPDHRFEVVSNISSEDFLDILKSNKKRYRSSEPPIIELSADYVNIVNFINIECSAAAVNLVKSLWLKRFSE